MRDHGWSFGVLGEPTSSELDRMLTEPSETPPDPIPTFDSTSAFTFDSAIAPTFDEAA